MKSWWQNLSPKQYRDITDKLKEAATKKPPQSSATKRKRGLALRGQKRSPETRERLRKVNRKRMENPEARERLRQAGLLSPEARERQRISVTKTMRTPEMREKFRKILNSPEAREKVRLAMQTPEYKEKMRQNMLHRKFPQKMTSIEKILLQEFNKRRLKFIMHKPMFGKFKPDFVFEQAKLIVEADGEYWHRSRDHQPLYDAASSEGWTVWRFPGQVINKKAAICAKAVAHFVRLQEKGV